MNYKRWCVIFLAGIMIPTGAIQVAAQSQSDDHLKDFYEVFIAQKIDRCQSKSELQQSRSKNLRLEAAIAAEKVRFLSINKDILVEEMLDQKIGKKKYKINVFLNKKFFDGNDGLSSE